MDMYMFMYEYTVDIDRSVLFTDGVMHVFIHSDSHNFFLGEKIVRKRIGSLKMEKRSRFLEDAVNKNRE